MTTSFTVTWDYRCPFARIGHQHVIGGLRAGGDWEVRYVPLSLGQMHVEEGQPDVWDDPGQDSGILALQVGTTVRDHFPEQFLETHLALFDARHVEGRDLRERSVLTEILDEHGVPATAVFAEVDSGAALKQVRADHESVVDGADAWGVPTFIVGDQAVFVRLMEGPGDDDELARRSVERILDLLTGWPELNEFKHTTLSR